MLNEFKYKLDTPVSLNEKGKRDYSEDYIFPKTPTQPVDERIFMVCDGVGGSTRGDEASKFVCKRFPELINKLLLTLTPEDFREHAQSAFLNNQLRQLEDEMEAYTQLNPQFRGMATTMTYLHLSNYGAVVAWAGDSRVYHVRNGEAKFITEDHSLVNELVKRGEITREEAANHPRKNMILRAVSGSTNPTKLDVKMITDIQPGDYFILLTDGILEGIAENHLLDLLKSEKSLSEQKHLIQQNCEAYSRDNYSMYLIHINSVEKTGHSFLLPESQLKTVADGPILFPTKKNVKPTGFNILPFSKIQKIIIFSAILILTGGTVFYAWFTLTKKETGDAKKVSTTENSKKAPKSNNPDSTNDSGSNMTSPTESTSINNDSDKINLQLPQGTPPPKSPPQGEIIFNSNNFKIIKTKKGLTIKKQEEILYKNKTVKDDLDSILIKGHFHPVLKEERGKFFIFDAINTNLYFDELDEKPRVSGINNDSISIKYKNIKQRNEKK